MNALPFPVIQTVDLWRIYQPAAHQQVAALRGISLQVEAGTFVALKGRSGSGKTTLLNCLGGLDRPTSGRILIFDQDLSDLNDAEITQWRRERLGFVFQSFGLLPTLSAFENVELLLRLSGRIRTERIQRSQDCLELVGLKKFIHHRPYELSGGQQQRLAIARALANHPRLILADEPTGELDSSTAREIFALLKRIAEEESTCLLVASHDPLIDEYAHRIIVLQDGQVVDVAQ